jgi:hypothetical protein
VVFGGSLIGSASFGGGTLSTGDDLNGFVAKHDSSGGHVWSIRIGGSRFAVVEAIAIAEDGDVIAAAWFDGTIGVGDVAVSSVGETDLFVVRLDGLSGAARWLGGVPKFA